MDLQLRVLILGQDREGRITGSSTNLQDDLGTGIFLGYLGQNREFLLEPFAILEKVGSIVLVEQIPPSSRVLTEFS